MTGEIHYALGDMRKAIDYQEQALPKARQAGDRNLEAAIMNGLANAHDIPGEKQKALSYYAQALPLRRAVKDSEGEATTLFNMAVVERPDRIR